MHQDTVRTCSRRRRPRGAWGRAHPGPSPRTIRTGRRGTLSLGLRNHRTMMHACIVCVCSRSSNQNIRTAPALEVRTRRVRTQRAENPAAIFTGELRSHGRSESSDLCSRYECCIPQGWGSDECRRRGYMATTFAQRHVDSTASLHRCRPREDGVGTKYTRHVLGAAGAAPGTELTSRRRVVRAYG